MSFTLNLEFSGLCLYVDDKRDELAKLHVLLLSPDMAGGEAHAGHAHADRHFARIFYDTAHDPDAPQRMATGFNSVSVEDKALDLSWIRGELDTTIDALPNLSVLAQSTVDPVLVGPNPGKLVTARITVAAGRGTPLKAEGPWELDPTAPRVMIAHKIGWSMMVDRDQLDWHLLGLNNFGGQPLTPLRPVSNEITLKVKNVMRNELSPRDVDGPAPRKGDNMDHFPPFYDALLAPKRRLIPAWRGEDGPGGPIGGNFRCGGARATV